MNTIIINFIKIIFIVAKRKDKIMGIRYIFNNLAKKSDANKLFMLKCTENELEIIENILSDVYEDLEFEKQFNKIFTGRQKEVYKVTVKILKRINKIKK
jgi:hypothetical protein